MSYGSVSSQVSARRWSDSPMQPPRVNGRTLPKFEGQPVVLVGRCVSNMDQVAIISTSDQQQVQVMLNGVSMPNQAIVELTGILSNGVFTQTAPTVTYSDNFNMEAYEEMLKLTQQADMERLF